MCIRDRFDTVGIEHIRDSLLEHGGEEDPVQWYYNLLQERHLKLELHGEELDICTNRGFPQGGVASAKFWLIAFNPAIEIINKNKITGNGYADDCSALTVGVNTSHMVNRMQKMLDELTAWGRTCLLYTSPSPRDGLLSRMPSSA